MSDTLKSIFEISSEVVSGIQLKDLEQRIIEECEKRKSFNDLCISYVK